MTTSLKYALFEEIHNGQPLFKTQRELAELICRERGTPEKLQSVTVFLSQMANGTRPVPSKWEKLMQTVVERRARERNVREHDLTIVLNGIARDQPKAESALGKMIAEQLGAHDTLILNACPLELTAARITHVEADTLQNIVMSALDAGRRYHYCLANQGSAQKLRSALLEAAGTKFGESTATEKVRNWIEKNLLSISIVPELLLLHPTVAYNTRLPDRLKTFVWHAPYDWNQCLALPDQQTVGWLKQVQGVLDQQSEKFLLTA